MGGVNRLIPKNWFEAYLNFKKYDVVCHWKINNFCNYKCAYCYLRNNSNDKEFVNKFSPKEISNAFDKTKLIWHIRMDGGEPFFYPNFVELCKNLTKKHYISLNTNLSHKKIFEFVNIINPKKVIALKCSFHHGEIQKYNQLNKFINKIKLLIKKKFNVLVTVVFYPPYINKIKEEFKIFKKKGIPISGRVFSGVYKGKLYPESYTQKHAKEFREYLDPLDTYFLSYGKRFYGTPCLAGKRFVLFKNDGSLQRCGSISKSLGNIFKGDIKLYKNSLPCVSDYCNCAYVGYLLTK